MLLIRLVLKNMWKFRNLPKQNTKITCNSSNGLKDIMISTVENEEIITMLRKRGVLLPSICPLPKKLSSQRPTLVPGLQRMLTRKLKKFKNPKKFKKSKNLSQSQLIMQQKSNKPQNK